MRLADFIASNVEPILIEWERFASSTSPGASMDTLALRDHAREILLATVEDMRSAQSRTEQAAKAKGEQTNDSSEKSLDTASDLHAVGRLRSGFDLLEVVAEYRALRASVLQLWQASLPPAHHADLNDVTRFNEAIDQSLTEAVSGFTKRADESRDLFLAILSHDLRSPLHSIAIASQLLPRLIPDKADALQVVSQIAANTEGMSRMISDLLDYTRSRLGAGMPVVASPMDLGELGQELFDQFQSSHPDHDIHFQPRGNLSGDWDTDRLHQALSNLLGNAIQHGSENAPISFNLNGESADVVIEVRSRGNPIAAERLQTIFDPLVRGVSAEGSRQDRRGSMGLGLYIVREIVEAHGGSIKVTSSAAAGTAFTIRLPRKAAVKAEPDRRAAK